MRPARSVTKIFVIRSDGTPRVYARLLSRQAALLEAQALEEQGLRVALEPPEDEALERLAAHSPPSPLVVPETVR